VEFTAYEGEMMASRSAGVIYVGKA